jgi:hypothetical protein
MSGVKKYDYSTLTTAIRDYTEVSSDVLTTTIVDGIIMAAEFRIYQELPMDSARFVQEGTLAANDNTIPKYYAMFGGADNTTDTSSGGMYLAPTPDANYKFRIYYNKMPNGLGSGTGFNNNTYLSTYFPQGLLYACLVEAFGYLKGPTDMLTYYENRYKNAVQQFAGMQLGRRRRDDYTDGTVRIPVKSPSP